MNPLNASFLWPIIGVLLSLPLCLYPKYQPDVDLKTDIAIAQLKTGDLDSCKSLLDTVLATQPDHFKANYALGHYAIMRQDYGLARLSLENALKKTPDDPDAMLSLSSTYLKLRLYPETQTLAKAALQKYPDRPDFYTNLGYAQIGSHEYALAKQTLELYLKKNPTASDKTKVEKKIAQLKSHLAGTKGGK
jgi:uncharacterized protein HemY